MSNRTPDNHPYNREKFAPRVKRGKAVKKRPSYAEMVRRARQRIIGATRKRGDGFIQATNLNDAVAALKKWVRSTDGKIGRGEQVYNVIKTAFRQLFHAGVFTRVRLGYKLNPPLAISYGLTAA